MEEYYDMFNEAAGIKGEFNRVDYNDYHPKSAPYAIKQIETDLPSYIYSLYYYDYIGNISSSSAYRE